jgi:hypothetical protein
LLLVGAGVVAVWAVAGVWAATTPGSGTLSPTNPVITFAGGPFAVSNPSSPTAETPPVCTDDICGRFALTVDIPANDPNTYDVKVSVGWTNAGTTTQGGTTSDYDVFVYKPDLTGEKLPDNGANDNPEEVTFSAASGAYTVYVVPYDVSPDVSFQGKITLTRVVEPEPTATPTPEPTPVAPPGTPRFVNYAAPAGVADDWGEPSIGVNWLTGKVMFFGGLSQYALRVSFDDRTSPARVAWDQLPLVLNTVPRAVGGDPILYTDKDTGRTFISQLQFGTTTATLDYTDNDGATFHASAGAGIASGIDHQTIGGGPYSPSAPLGALYPNAVYYCSQSIAEAGCALSIDGGRTFGPSVPIYGVNDCGGLHGHVKVAPDGTVYVPNPACGGSLPFHDDGYQAVIVSEDSGLTWTIRPVPNTRSADADPSVAAAKDGALYFAYAQGEGGPPHVAVSRDKGRTWTDNQNVGTQLGLKGSEFPAMVAGDGGPNGRAAVAFFGTTTQGNFTAPDFPGVWYLYVASTFDGGKTWTTTNITPGDPVQRGGICGSGTCRNLLDFFDAAIDREGRILVGYDDGCTGPCVQGPPNSFASKGVIARQSGGRRMYAQYDPPVPSVPGAPQLTATKTSAAASSVHLAWLAPDDGGAAVVSYNIYRRAGTGTFTLLTSTAATAYDDAITPGVSYAYRVRAVNGMGEGPAAGDVVPIVPPPAPPPPNPCVAPGVLVLNDMRADGTDDDAAPNLPLDARFNIKQVYIAEPYFADGSKKLVFTIRVGQPLAPTGAPANSQWYIIWNRLYPDANFDRWWVGMKTDGAGALRYEYGRFGVALDQLGPNPNANTAVKVGDADAGTYDPATGTITITLSTSKAERIKPGQPFYSLTARTFMGQPDAAMKSTRTATDTTGEGLYVLSGNASCH